MEDMLQPDTESSRTGVTSWWKTTKDPVGMLNHLAAMSHHKDGDCRKKFTMLACKIARWSGCIQMTGGVVSTIESWASGGPDHRMVARSMVKSYGQSERFPLETLIALDLCKFSNEEAIPEYAAEQFVSLVSAAYAMMYTNKSGPDRVDATSYARIVICSLVRELVPAPPITPDDPWFLKVSQTCVDT